MKGMESPYQQREALAIIYCIPYLVSARRGIRLRMWSTSTPIILRNEIACNETFLSQSLSGSKFWKRLQSH